MSIGIERYINITYISFSIEQTHNMIDKSRHFYFFQLTNIGSDERMCYLRFGWEIVENDMSKTTHIDYPVK